MFKDLVDFPIESERLQWEARMVIRDLDQVPYVLMRIKLAGTHFPQRALKPFVVVGKVRSLFVTIADDGLSACAYFDKPLPEGNKIEFGYGDQILLRFPRAFSIEMVKLLDPKKVPKNTHLIERFFKDRM